MRTNRSVLLAGAACLALVVPGASHAAGTAPAPVDHYTALSVTVLAQPHPVAGADRHLHLAYELMLLNWTRLSATVERIEVLDAGRDGRLLADFSGAALDAAVSSITQVPGRAVAPGTMSKAVLDVRLPLTARPRTIVHRLTVTTDAPAGALRSPFLAARTPVATDQPVVLAPPLRGPGWANLTGCCTPDGHRLILQGLNGGLHLAQRFAVDTARLTGDGRLFDGPADDVTSYPGYGRPVHAGAAGTVVAVVDGMPDQIPFRATEPTDVASISGNHVIVDLGDGRHLYHAHLRPGSVRVARGDRVRAGQQLGEVGNSGNSDLPHLHLQVMDGPSPLASDGLPFVLRSFDSAGSVPPPADIDLTAPIPVGPELSGRHTSVTPMIRQVIDYPPA